MDTIYGEVIERRRVLRYAGLFLFLVFIYAVALSRYLNFIAAEGKPGGPVINTPLDLMPPIVWFCFFSALPIAALACYDKDWSSSAAAPICFAAWAIVAEGFMIKLHNHCLLMVGLPFLPFLASATAAHAVGRGARYVFDKAWGQ